MQMKEYIVTLNKNVDYDRFWHEIEHDTSGLTHVPDRAVDIAHNRTYLQRTCEYWLSDNEADNLRNDARVLSVEQPVRNLDHVSPVSNSIQNIVGMNYNKQPGNITFNYITGATSLNPSNYTNNINASTNWGLIRHNSTASTYTNNPTGTTISTTSQLYSYVLDGSGVDIVINDSGIQADHPEFAGRITNVNWDQIAATLGIATTGWNTASYTDTDGHGTHVAATAAGATYGWAKGARIIPLYLFPVGQSSAEPLDMFEMLIYWHQNKGDGRPTVVNMSWDLRFNFLAPFNQGMSYCNNYFSGGSYRGSSWTRGTGQSDSFYQQRGLIALTANGWPGQGPFLQFPYSSDAYNAALAQVIDAGIIVCQAAGNNGFKIDVPGGPDYNNYVLSGGIYYYHRGASPKDPRAIVVGALDNKTSATGQDQRAEYSVAGPGVDIWAAGTYIMSAGCTNPAPGKTQSNQGDTAYFRNNSFKEFISVGTSFASPQITGMVALYLQANPLANIFSPNNSAIAKSWLTNNAITNSFLSVGDATSYTNSLSLLGGAPRVAYQAIQGLTQIKAASGTYTPVKNVYVKAGETQWSAVGNIWTKTGPNTWQQVYQDN